MTAQMEFITVIDLMKFCQIGIASLVGHRARAIPISSFSAWKKTRRRRIAIIALMSECIRSIDLVELGGRAVPC